MGVPLWVSAAQYTLTVIVSPEGAGSVLRNPDKPVYHEGEQVTLIPNANPGWAFSHWSGDVSGSDNPLTFNISSNMSVTANFEERDYVVIVRAAPSQAGDVVKRPDKATYNYNDPVEIEAIPQPGWKFDNWSGSTSGTTNPKTIRVRSDMDITANFSQIHYELNISINPPGRGRVRKTPDKPYYVYGDEVQLKAIGDPGYPFQNWSGDLTGSENPVTITIDGNKNITANFTAEQYTVTVAVQPSGTGSVTKDPERATYTYGNKVELTAHPQHGWRFQKWRFKTFNAQRVTVS